MQRRLFLKSLVLTGVLTGSPHSTVWAQEKTYWLGTREGDSLQFLIRLPADAVAVILHKSNAPDRGDDTRPRYKTFTQTVSGKSVVLHTTELGWETPKLDEGNLTWVVDAGLGADWRQCDTKDPLWGRFAAALKSIGHDSAGWSSAKVVVVEQAGSTAPTIRLNRDGTSGKPTPLQLALWKLSDLSGKERLSEGELAQVRTSMLAVANAGRVNPDYRRQNGSKTALELPKGLAPLVLNEIYNKAAQNQAEYCAQVKMTTHDQEDEKYATVAARVKAFGGDKGGYEAAGAGPLSEYPTSWMKSETHYRPWWNLDGEVVTVVGFGVAKSSDGTWYMVALLG